MDEIFKENELLLRAVKPTGIFIKEDGSISSAVFKDSKGLSVNRTGDDDADVVIRFTKNHFNDCEIWSVKVSDCNEIKVLVKYAPIDENIYHSEIHRNSETA